MQKKIVSILIVSTILMTFLVGCNSNNTDKVENSKTEEIVFKLAHNLNEQHSVHLALAKFAELIEEKSSGEMKVEIFPNGQLGSEEEVLEQLQTGAVHMTKVSAAALTTYADGYNAFTLPYIFTDKDHFFKSMESDIVDELYKETEEDGFIGLTYYTSGARSFYTKDKPILHPDDLKGEKIRVMGYQSQTDMMKALKGTPVGTPYSEVYTSLQSGVIDGAESNETALTNGKHGEVAKHFSYDEHTMIPDIVVIGSDIWNKLTEEQQNIIQESAKESTEYHKPIWDKAIEESITEAKEDMGVEFHEVDKEPFREAVQPMLDEYSEKSDSIKKLLDKFKELE